jgi:hypothetical protein
MNAEEEIIAFNLIRLIIARCYVNSTSWELFCLANETSIGARCSGGENLQQKGL